MQGNKTLTRRFLWLYCLLLHLYPARFRTEFSDEMQQVFAQALESASGKGALSLVCFGIQELFGLPGSLLQVRFGKHHAQPTISVTPIQPVSFHLKAWQEFVLGLAVFLLPAGVILNHQNTQPLNSSAILAAFFFLVVMVFLGWVGGLSLWSIPYIGIILVVAGYLVLFQWVANLASPALVSNLTPGQLDHSSYLLLRAASTGMLWLMLFCLTLLIVALLAVFNRFQPLFRKIRHDWTLISYILYGESVFVLLLLFGRHRFEPTYSIAALFCLSAGVWFYLRGAVPANRLAVLASCLTLAMAIAVLANWTSTGGQTLFTMSNLLSTEPGRLLLSWVWMLAALFLPGLLVRFSAPGMSSETTSTGVGAR